jgi:RND family efflux transporter MFP subunit
MSRRTGLAIGLGLLVIAGGAAVWMARRDAALAPASSAKAEGTTWYTCGMHPEVVDDHPGSCPKCGMELRPMSADRAAALGLEGAPAETAAPAGERKVLYWKSSMITGEIHESPGKDSMGMDLVPVYADEVTAGSTIRIDPVTEQDMGIRVDTVTRGPLRHTVRTVAYVDYDETALTEITTKVDGWIEKLFVDQTGAQVHAGDPLFALYSPALFSAQEEYLAAIRNQQQADVPAVPRSRADSRELVRSARTRLEYFDISAEQIAELERTGTVRKTLVIRAPFTGIVTHKNVVEGQMVKAGAALLRLADLSTVWVIAKVYEYDLPYVALGQEAFMTLTYLPGRTFHGRVTFVYPYLETKTREVSVRMEFHNPGYELKPGMYATVTLTSQVAADAVLVPDTAVIDTGTRAVVFVVAGPGRFEPREIRRGLRSDGNRIQALSGVSPGETVVVSGQFLLDSESRLREAALKFLPPGKVDGATPIESATAAAEGAKPAGEARKYWVCPMPEHADTLYDAPGRCPLCGMALVPAERQAGHLERPRIAYWTCPMPEHHTVRKPGPGKCPICGMTLIPVPEEAQP